MKIYVLYIDGNYPRVLLLSAEKSICENEMRACKMRGCTQKMWIKEYDFSNSDRHTP